MDKTLLKSVVKTFDLLDIFVFEDYERNGIGLVELANRLEQRPNTLHYLLQTMIACGYVSQNQDGKYLAGPKCSQIGFINKYMTKNVVIEKIEPIMQKLSDTLQETVVFYVLLNGRRINLLKIEHTHPIKIDFSSIEETDSIYEKPTGRVLVAFADEYAFQVIKKTEGYPGSKWSGISTDEDFKKALEPIRKQGYIQQYTPDKSIISMAVPVLDSQGQLLGAVGAYAPLFRCDEKKQKVALIEMQEVAKELVHCL